MSEFDGWSLENTPLEAESRTRGLGALALAAAVGAGVALFLTSEGGRRARHLVARKVHDLELGERLRERGVTGPREAAGDRSALYATLGTVAGAALAALMTPQGGRETREWIGHTFEDLRNNASLRWREHRAAKRRPAGQADRGVERLEMNGGVSREGFSPPA
jgi:hypothetical protein